MGSQVYQAALLRSQRSLPTDGGWHTECMRRCSRHIRFQSLRLGCLASLNGRSPNRISADRAQRLCEMRFGINLAIHTLGRSPALRIHRITVPPPTLTSPRGGWYNWSIKYKIIRCFPPGVEISPSWIIFSILIGSSALSSQLAQAQLAVELPSPATTDTQAARKKFQTGEPAFFASHAPDLSPLPSSAASFGIRNSVGKSGGTCGPLFPCAAPPDYEAQNYEPK